MFERNEIRRYSGWMRKAGLIIVVVSLTSLLQCKKWKE